MVRTKHVAIAAAMSCMALATPCRAAGQQPVELQIVDALNKLYGSHPGFRANHAKGLVAEGHFKPAPGASKLSKAVIFQGAAIPVTVRFSDASGLPNVADGAPVAKPHGLSIKFHLPDGSDTDMVLNSFKFFPVATGPDFLGLQLAAIASPPTAPKPTQLDKFKKSHPSVTAALATLGVPDSFADENYFGIDAFIFANQAGQKQAVRYEVLPQKLVHLSATDVAKDPPNFLVDDLPQRLKRGPVVFELKAQLAAPTDPTNDATKPWPDNRPVVDLGTLTIEKASPDSLEAQKKLLFLPGQLTDGIEKSGDPLVDARDAAYAISFGRRSQ